jgi:hypothetical protein
MGFASLSKGNKKEYCKSFKIVSRIEDQCGSGLDLIFTFQYSPETYPRIRNPELGYKIQEAN